MENFTPIESIIGGLLIGFSTAFFRLTTGRICGISGLSGNIVLFIKEKFLWSFTFIASIVLGAYLTSYFGFGLETITIAAPYPLLIIGAFLVGFGTKIANGCTSGHSICGISRLSPRSYLATILFIGSAMITYYILHHVLTIEGV